MSDEDKRIIGRWQIHMLKAIGRMYLAAYVSGNQKPFLESLHHAWFSFFTPTDSMQQYVYMPESLDPNSEEYVDVKRVCERVDCDIEWVRYTLMRTPKDEIAKYAVSDYLTAILVRFISVQHLESLHGNGAQCPRHKAALLNPFTPYRT